jgi:rhodanese-related sulfurtransferase
VSSKFAVLKWTIASCLLLTILSCQQSLSHPDSWKQQQIEKMYEGYHREFPKVKSITAAQLQQWQQSQPIILVDVRTPQERRVSIIPNAITKEEFEKNLARYRNPKIVVYCTIGYRSGKYAQKLSKNLQIFNLEGGILAWSHIGGKLTDERGATIRIHVFGNRWQLAPHNYQSVW